MGSCIIHPVPLFEFSLNKSLMTYRLNFDQQAPLVCYVWYIEGTNERILIDAGDSAERRMSIGGMPVKEIQTLDSGLSQLGISLSDIDHVILTHLHADHMAQASRFPNARFLIQKDELKFAQNPHPSVAMMYPMELISGLNFEVISGDTKICEEVSVLSTPGHTPGGQSVSIKTAQGTAIISGLCTIRENFEPPSSISQTMPVITPGIHVNALEAYDSLLRIKEMADIVVPNHDPEFRQRSSIP